MSQKQYWKGLEEQQGTEAHKVAASNEFSEPLPFDMSEGLLEAQTPRRDFLNI
jgi:MoCo/4Fe-4S cofactor protein with predicted Tat translocation signal